MGRLFRLEETVCMVRAEEWNRGVRRPEEEKTRKI